MWAEAEDFQSILISSLMWADHMPDFVLEALNKCLPHREQEIEWVKREREETPYLQVPGQRSSRTSNSFDESGGKLFYGLGVSITDVFLSLDMLWFVKFF